jgi:hypothetical protein
MNFLHQEFDLDAGEIVEVTLDNPANVQLLDPENYEAYRNGRQFHYYGGHATVSPIQIQVPRAGHWHLVVDLGGDFGRVRASARLLSGATT